MAPPGAGGIDIKLTAFSELLEHSRGRAPDQFAFHLDPHTGNFSDSDEDLDRLQSSTHQVVQREIDHAINFIMIDKKG